MQLTGLFPIPLGRFFYPKEDLKETISFLETLEKVRNESNLTSKNSRILELDILFNIKNFFYQSISDYIKEVYRPRHDFKVRITQSWVNYTGYGEQHHIHYHPNSFISGVFYLNSIEEGGSIAFHRPFVTHFHIPFIEDDDHPFTGDARTFNPEAGMLLLFPSYLKHEVKKNKITETRISISFNTYVGGYIGNDESLTGLDL